MTDNRTTETVTDRLRALLDERGVEWKDGDAAYEIEWKTPDGRHCSAMYWKPTFTVLINGCTPEQAIAATLGSGTCHMSFIDEYETASGEEEYLCECSECGYRRWEHAHDLPLFCSKCGRKVKR